MLYYKYFIIFLCSLLRKDHIWLAEDFDVLVIVVAVVVFIAVFIVCKLLCCLLLEDFDLFKGTIYTYKTCLNSVKCSV